MAAKTNRDLTIGKIEEVTDKVKLGTSTIYKKIKEGTFPEPIKMGPGAKSSGWVMCEIDDWIVTQMNARKSAKNEETTQVKGI